MRRLINLSAMVLLMACDGGQYAGEVGGAGAGATAPEGDSHFAQKVQPRLEFCRTCHVPDGVADVPGGRDFALSPDADEDYLRLQASWQRLGGNNPVSRILRMASGQETPHSGGEPWPPHSEAYADVEQLLDCFERGQDCEHAPSAPREFTAQSARLLESKRGGHDWFAYCADRPDNAALPVDPRSLVQPGVNAGRAVLFNVWWKDCHIDPERVGEQAHPGTCGELRQRWARGQALLRGDGQPGSGSLFAGHETGGYAAISADVYNRLWQSWGLPGRPDNFDELVMQRFGFARGSAANPYPLPGEDPNQTAGGSGQLPTAFTQLRHADGSWSGNIGITCHGCHSSVVGLPQEGPGLGVALLGAGSSPHDMGLMARDLGAAGHPLFGSAAFTGLFGKTRGTGNPINVQAIILMTGDIRISPDTAGFFSAPSAGSEDAPAWWNTGHRPVKFFDGFLSMDADRADLGLFLPFLDRQPRPSGQAAAQAWVREHAQDAALWVSSLRSPEYPLPVDEALASQGAILFHNLDLWAPGRANEVPRPTGGNGSCASCHGVHSAHYASDPAFLETPELEGMAAYLVPLAIIGTDPARAVSNSDAASEYGRGNFYAYPETDGLAPEYDCGPQTRVGLRGDRQRGYLAPPLYGVWATAPYFHNGSVPNVWEVLEPAARPAVWRRLSAPARPDQAGQVVMGYDSSLARAYDQEKLGWRYEILTCGDQSVPLLDCNPGTPDQDPLLPELLSQLYLSVGLSWNAQQPPISHAQAEARKVYNTHEYSQSNTGHAFTAGLSVGERRALIEYLKTL